MSGQSIFKNLDDTGLVFVQTQMDRLQQANNIISACTVLLNQFIKDDENAQELPAEIKSNFVKDGLLSAIILANNDACSVSDLLEIHFINASNQKDVSR
jgi:hypothetical protein